MKLLLERITSAPGYQIRAIALRIEQIARKAFVNNGPYMRNAQMNDAFVKAPDAQLARIAFKKLQTTNQQHWNHGFHFRNELRKFIKKILLEHT